MKFAIVGAGFTGSVLAHELAKSGHIIEVFESRSHVAGNCYSERDAETGILVHKYGPHIFHTDNKDVWDFVNRFSEFEPYINRVKTTVNQRIYSLPINLHTINQFFSKAYTPSQAKDFIASLSDKSITDPKSFEEQALKFLGKELYEAFFEGYTVKQWGLAPSELPASILKRLPVRFSYDDNYFNHQFQGMPKNGYTPIVEKLLEHDSIVLNLSSKFNLEDRHSFDHVFYTGPIDGWFKFSEGRLGYRTLDFKREVHDGDYQGCAVMNYGDKTVPYTRISEHKHFSPWELHNKTVVFKEYSRACEATDIPYYPIRLLNEKVQLQRYVGLAKKEQGVSFLGRLGTYRYLDMDVTISEAMSASQKVLSCLRLNHSIPTFFNMPL